MSFTGSPLVREPLEPDDETSVPYVVSKLLSRGIRVSLQTVYENTVSEMITMLKVYSTKIKTWLLRVCVILSLLSIAAPLHAAPERAELDEYDIGEAFIPETTNQKAAYAFSLFVSNATSEEDDSNGFVSGGEQTVFPCHMLQVKYSNSYGYGVYDHTNTDPTTVTSEEYKNTLFPPISRQSYKLGEKYYLIPLRYGFVDQERYINAKLEKEKERLGVPTLTTEQTHTIVESATESHAQEERAFVERYPDGEFVGYVKMYSQLIRRPLDLTKEEDQKILENPSLHITDISETGSSLSGEDERLIDWYLIDGEQRVLPTIYPDTWGETRDMIAYESCVYPSMHYIKGDYSDLEQSLIDTINSNWFYAGHYGLSFKGLRGGAYDYSSLTDPGEHRPMTLTHWISYRDIQRQVINNLDMTEFLIRAYLARFYFMHYIGTGLSISDTVTLCENASELSCWLQAGADTADALRDVTLLAKNSTAGKIVAGFFVATNKLTNKVWLLSKVPDQNAAKNAKVYMNIATVVHHRAAQVGTLADGALAALYAFKEDPEYIGVLERAFSGATSFDTLFVSSKGILPYRIKLKSKCGESPAEAELKILGSNAQRMSPDAKVAERVRTVPEDMNQIIEELDGVSFHQGMFHRVAAYKTTGGKGFVVKSPFALWGNPRVLSQVYVELGEFAKRVVKENELDILIPDFVNLGNGQYRTDFVLGRNINKRELEIALENGLQNPDYEHYDTMLEAIDVFSDAIKKEFPGVRLGNYEFRRVGVDPETGDDILMYLDENNLGNFLINDEGVITWIDPFAVAAKPAIVRNANEAFTNKVMDWLTEGDTKFPDFGRRGKLPDGRKMVGITREQPFATGQSRAAAYSILRQGVVEGHGSGYIGEGLYTYPRSTLAPVEDEALIGARYYASRHGDDGVILIGKVRADRARLANIAAVNEDELVENINRGWLHLRREGPTAIQSRQFQRFDIINLDVRGHDTMQFTFTTPNIMVLRDSASQRMQIETVLVPDNSGGYREQTPAQFVSEYEASLELPPVIIRPQ